MRIAPPLAARPGRKPEGFSMVEMIVTLTILALVVAALTAVLLHATMSRLQSGNRFESLQTARVALDMIASDLRSAGYGVDATHSAGGQPAIAYVDSMQILMCENQTPYPDSAAGPAAPEAYDPAGSPQPQPLVASEWTPPVKYRTGAELIRYTLDLDNDGHVDANDVASAEGADAQRSKNPDDFTLVRQVYGAGTGGQADDNGGVAERVALVLRPGGGVPAMFTVYLNGSSTPWDWSLGPVPASQLAAITRVVIKVTASSGHPDAKGRYSRTVLETAVGSMRNAPSLGAATYTVDGYVFEDSNVNGNRDTGEPGLQGAVVRLGTGRVAYTTSAGYFSFRVPTGHYVLRHVSPSGYGSFTWPDTFALDVASNETRAFADTARHGGWITVTAWNDANGNGTKDVGESMMEGVTVTLSPGGAEAITDASGQAQVFASTGGWSMTSSPPATYAVTTAGTVSGTMTQGGTCTASFGMRQSSSGTVNGTVFHDLNANGVFDGGDTGIPGVVVTLTSGGSAYATATTDGGGAFTFTAPAAGGGTTYGLTCPAQTGYYPSTPLSISPVTLTPGATLSGKNFGFASYTSIPITTGAILNMIAKDFYENDRSGGTYPSTNGDVDLAVTLNDGGIYRLAYYLNKYPGTVFTAADTLRAVISSTPHGFASDTTTAGSLTPEIFIGADGRTTFWRRIPGSTSATTPPLAKTKELEESNDDETLLSLATIDCSGGSAPDLLVGTKNVSSGKGCVHVWTNNNGSNPGFSEGECYPTAGGIPGAHMGEANALVLADIDGDGANDLVIGTRLTATSGEIIVMRNVGRVDGNRFVYEALISVSGSQVKALSVFDVDGDGRPDIVAGTSSSATASAVGTSSSATAGKVLVYHNAYDSSPWTFTQTQSITAPGSVNCLSANDFGGSSATDVAIGYTTNTASFLGGVAVLYGDGSALSTTPVDPTNGAVTHIVTAMASGNFNYATHPSVTPAPHLADLAIGWQDSATTGGILVLVR